MTNFLNPHDFYITFELFLTDKDIDNPLVIDTALPREKYYDHPDHLEELELRILLAQWNRWRFAENVPLAFRRFREAINKNKAINDELRIELIDLIDEHIDEALKHQSKEFKLNIQAAVGIY